MTPTLVSDLLLLALDDERGKYLIDTTTLDYGVAAAAVVELVADGYLHIGPEGRRDAPTLRRTDQPPPTGVLGEIVERVDGRKLKDALGRVTGMSWRNRAKTLREDALAELVQRGQLTAEKGRLLGVIPVDRHPAADATHERALRADLERVLAGEAEADQRTGALIALLHGLKGLPKVFPDRDRKALTARAAEISEGQWAGPAVAGAVADMQLLIATMAVAAVVTTTSS